MALRLGGITGPMSGNEAGRIKWDVNLYSGFRLFDWGRSAESI
jgi:hypothetical protein